MDTSKLEGLTVYQDLITVLEEKGYSDAEVAEIFAKLTAQAEMETTEEIVSKLTDEQLGVLDGLAENAPASEIAEKLGIDGEEVDAIRADKVAQLIQEMIPTIDKDEEESSETPPVTG